MKKMFWAILFALSVAAGALLLYSFRSKITPRAVLLVTLPLLGLTLYAYQASEGAVGAETAGEERYDLSGELYTLEGEPVNVAEFEGKLIFMNFWATWCGPCRAEMPSMAKLYEELGEEGLVMLAITDEEAEPVRKYLEKSPYPFKILLDPEAILFRKLRVRGLPTTFVFNEKHELELEHVGAENWARPDIMAEFRKMLAEED